MSQEIELKPCPFCGKAELENTTGTKDREGYPFSLTCAECGATGPWVYQTTADHPESSAIKAWNTRATPSDSLRKAAEALFNNFGEMTHPEKGMRKASFTHYVMHTIGLWEELRSALRTNEQCVSIDSARDVEQENIRLRFALSEISRFTDGQDPESRSQEAVIAAEALGKVRLRSALSETQSEGKDGYNPACGDCDPCIGGRPDQCALICPTSSPNLVKVREALVEAVLMADDLVDSNYGKDGKMVIAGEWTDCRDLKSDFEQALALLPQCDGQDTERLNWLMRSEAKMCFSSDGEGCWLHWPYGRRGEDEGPFGQAGAFDTPRQAIDSAMKEDAARNKSTGGGK